MANITSVYDLPHVANIEPMGNPTVAYRITMEDGYWIHKPAFGENIWKTVTFIYLNEDFTVIDIRATNDLPEGADLCGGDTNSEHEVV